MVHIRPKWFFLKTIQKLHARSVRPFKILTQLNHNDYVIDHLNDLGISSTFNIKDLMAYKDDVFIPSNSLLDEPI